MAFTAVAPQRLVKFFGDVRTAHHHWNANRANGVGHAIGLGDHSCHCADSNQVNILLAHVARDPVFVHGLSVAVDQQYFMS